MPISLLWAAPVNTLLPNQSSKTIQLSYLSDRTGELDLRDVINQIPESTWQTLNKDSVNLGYSTDPIWLHFYVGNTSSKKIEQLIEITYPQLDFVDFYQIKNGLVYKHVETGDRRPYNTRLIDHPHFLFPIKADPNSNADVYIRVQTQGALQVPLKLWDTQPFFIAIDKEDQIHSLYFGILIVIVIFNFFVFVALRESTYLFYSLSTLGYLLFFATLRANTFQVIWPNSPQLQNQVMLIVIPFTGMFAGLFARSFLSLKENSPRVDILIKIVILASFISVLASFVLSYNASIKLSVLLSIPSFLVLLGIGPYAWYKKFLYARYYTLAWGALTLGSAVTAMNKYGFIPSNLITEYGMQIGSAFEAILLTVALAERLYREREDKLEAQTQTLKENAERRHAEERLIHHAMHHPITGLPNRVSFEVLIKEHLDSTSPKRLAVCLVHLMRFQEINKTLGYNNADLLLSEIGLKIDQMAKHLPGIIKIEDHVSIRNTDFRSVYTCSFEGASFGLILDADIAQASMSVVEETVEEIFKPIDFKNMRLELAPATGVAISPDHGLDPSTLIRHAHVALEAAENNHGKLAYYRAEQDKYNARRLTIMSELKQAIKSDQLALFYQPKYDLKLETVVAVEALIRWNHHRFGFVPPDEFIPIAEQTGIIQSLTRWVVKEAFSHQKMLMDEGLILNMSINISAVDLRNPNFIQFIQDELNNHQLKPESVTLELTETTMMVNPEQALQMLESLHKTGVKISIDDFGSGYSSLSYIKRLPTDEIKIDKSLVFDLSDHKDDQVIIKTTIDMCHALGFQVVAEGVENQKSMDILHQIDCDLIQGYFLSPPLPFDKLRSWLHSAPKNRDDHATSA